MPLLRLLAFLRMWLILMVAEVSGCYCALLAPNQSSIDSLCSLSKLLYNALFVHFATTCNVFTGQTGPSLPVGAEPSKRRAASESGAETSGRSLREQQQQLSDLLAKQACVCWHRQIRWWPRFNRNAMLAYLDIPGYLYLVRRPAKYNSIWQ